jgi:hypothetical protein
MTRSLSFAKELTEKRARGPSYRSDATRPGVPRAMVVSANSLTVV